MLDDRTAARRELDALAHRVWNNRSNRASWTAYLSQPPGAAETPLYAVAARRDDLSGLPPTWIAVSDIDLFFDEARQYCDRLRAGGAHSALYLIPRAPHGFEAFLPRSRLARDLFQASYEFLRERLALSRGADGGA